MMGKHKRGRVGFLRSLVGVLGAALTLGMLTVAVGASPAAAAPGDGSITLSLTNWSDGLPATGGCMQVYDDTETLIGEDCVGSSGTYTVAPIPDGTYRVRLASFTEAVPTQWYGRRADFSSAIQIQITDGSVFADSYTLLQPNSIVGEVTTAGGGSYTGAFVEVWTNDEYDVYVTRVDITADGTFATGQLSCTSCNVRFAGFPGLADEWYPNDTSSGYADRIVPSATVPTVLDPVYINNPEGVISGTMVFPSNFVESTACVVLYENGHAASPTPPALYRSCGTPGDPFEFRHLPMGFYTVCVADTADPEATCLPGVPYSYDFQGWGHSPTYGTLYPLSSGETETITLAFGGTIEVVPQDLLGNPLSGGCVDVYAQSTGLLVASDCTDQAGTYAVSVGQDWSPVIAFKVLFRGFPGRADQWYSNAASLVEASQVTVNSGMTTVLEDVYLKSSATDGSITLDLTTWGTGEPGTGGCMQVVDEDEVLVAEDCVGSAGTYGVTGLEDGFYWVRLSDFADVAPTQWYGPAAFFDDATMIAIDSGSDFVDSHLLRPGNGITGQVVDGNGDPLAGGSVEVWDERGAAPLLTVDVDENGWFWADAPGCSYYCHLRYVGFAGLADEWYHERILSPYYQDRLYAVAEYPGLALTQVIDSVEGVLTGTIEVPSYFSSPTACVIAYGPMEFGSPLRAIGMDCGVPGETFEIRNLSEGPHVVCVADTDDPYQGCLGSAYEYDFFGAPPKSSYSGHFRVFDVTPGSTTTVDFAFGGTITATPTVSEGALSGGCMDVYEGRDGPLVGSDCDPVGGEFSVSVERDADEISGYGDYRVHFRDFVGGVDEWYNNKTSQYYATDVAVFAGETVPLTVELAPWAQIGGTITLPAETAATETCLTVITTDFITYSDEICVGLPANEYEVWVPPGEYFLEFWGDADDVAFEWYDSVASVADATPVTLASGESVVVDADLDEAAQITGTITAGGSPADGACVEVFEMDGDFVSLRCADASGHYILESLPAGSYYLYFEEFDSYLPKWYSNALQMADATMVTVTAGETQVVDVTLDPMGAIAGTVIGPGGEAVMDGCIYLYDDDWDLFDTACVDETGSYSAYVFPGTYRILFKGFTTDTGAPLGSEWWDNVADGNHASEVTIASGETVTLDSALVSGATLSGTVNGPSATLAQAGCVYIYDEDLNWIDISCVGTDGLYSLNLVPGDYLVQFFDFESASGQPLAEEWHYNAPSEGAATPVHLVAGDSVIVNATLELPVSVYGTVTVPEGAELDGGVYVYDSGTGAFVTGTGVNPDGSFEIDGLKPDTYKIWYHGFTGAANEWYSGDRTWATANNVTPSTSGTDLGTASLDSEGVIEGWFEVPSEFDDTVCVTAWYSNWYYVNDICGSKRDPFELRNLPAGTYYLEFTDDSGHEAFYNVVFETTDVPTPVSVSVGETTTLFQPMVTGVPDALEIPAGAPAGATVTVDPAPTTGTARIQYLNGSTWTTFGSVITLTGGTGHVTWNPGTSEFTYRFVYGSHVSDTFTVGIITPTVTGTPDAAVIPAGGTAGATVTVDPAPASGTARIQYLNRGLWTTFGPVITLTDGAGHVTWSPGTAEFTYRFVYGSYVSDTFAVGILAPTVTGTPDEAVIPPNTPAGATVTVDPAPSGGTARLQYLNGSTWTSFGPEITLTDGTGHITWNPGTSEFTYRFLYGSTASDTFTVGILAPTVTGVPDEVVIPPGSPAGATVTVDPAPTTGTARIQYLNGSTWTTFGPIITLTGGTGHVTWNPGTSEFTYRFIYGSTVSDTFTVGILAPTVTGVPDEAVIPPMTPAGATVTVDPAPTGGTARLQYLNGSTWTTFGPIITLTGGTGHVTWNPGTSEFTYRFIYGSTVSDTFTVGIESPTVTGTPDALTIPPMTPAGATVTVDPAPTGGTARLQYLNGSTWTTFGPVITLVDGTGHVTWNPGTSEFTYRFIYGSTVSDTFTVGILAPTVTGTPDAAEIPAMTPAGATVTVDPAPTTGTARIQYLNRGIWTTFGPVITLVNGTGHVIWNPGKSTFTYRFVYGSTVSETFVVTMIPTA